MKIFLISGFLGSGKTTFINFLLSTYFKEKSVVVLENESGKESVDGSLLRANNFNVVDLVSGCICCTLKDDFPKAIKRIEEEVNPDFLIIEPSGIASLRELLLVKDFKPSLIISLIDLFNYHLFTNINKEFYESQFRLSNLFVATKEDLMKEDKQITDDIFKHLSKINPNATICKSYKDLTPLLIDKLSNDIQPNKSNPLGLKFINNVAKVNKGLDDIKLGYLSMTELGGNNFGITSKDRVIEAIKLKQGELEKSGGMMIRLKGFVKVISKEMNGEIVTVKVDFTGGEVAFEQMPYYIEIKDWGLTFWHV